MKKVLIGAILSVAMVGCGVQTTPTINVNAVPDIQTIIAGHNLKPLTVTGSNLLSNGGFEDDLNGWTGCDTGVINKTADAQTGAAAVAIDNNCFFQSINVEVGKTYTLSCQIKETVDSGWTGMGFNFTDIAWSIVSEEVSVEVASTDYDSYSISRKAPAGVTYGSMWVFSSGSANVDNCEIIEGAAVSPVTPVEPVTPAPVEPVTPAPVEPVTPAPVTPVTPEPVEPVTPVAPNSITDIAIGAGLDKLVLALKATGLDSVLAQDAGGPYTVFAPTDAAFDTLLASLNLTFEELASNPQLVKEILLYHVIADELSLETFTEVQAEGDTRFETLQNEEDVDFGVFDGILYLDDLSGRKISASLTDVVASNGIVHVIDSVLLPPSVQDALANPNY